MALYPGARHRLIPAGSSDPPIIPIGVILHVDAGNSGSLYTYFNGPSGGIESHFFIRKDGGVEQYRDTSREADANYKANSFLRDGKRYGFISVETQGYEAGEWTDAQIREIKELLLWVHKTHGMPLRRCPAWDQAGVGYHVMFGAPGPWTPVSKSCPGPDRVRQFNNVLVPWMVEPTQEDDLSAAEVQDLKNFIEYTVQRYSAFNAKNLQQQLETLLVAFEQLEQTYAVAVNNFTRQDGDLGEDAILGALADGMTALKNQLVALAADVDAVQADVDALEAAHQEPEPPLA